MAENTPALPNNANARYVNRYIETARRTISYYDAANALIQNHRLFV